VCWKTGCFLFPLACGFGISAYWHLASERFTTKSSVSIFFNLVRGEIFALHRIYQHCVLSFALAHLRNRDCSPQWRMVSNCNLRKFSFLKARLADVILKLGWNYVLWWEGVGNWTSYSNKLVANNKFIEYVMGQWKECPWGNDNTLYKYSIQSRYASQLQIVQNIF
jgi:hypothetical protein